MPILETILAGVIGTLGMSLLMLWIHSARLAEADMVRALGSFVTRDTENALLPGLSIHFASGILFAFPYALFLSLILDPGDGGWAAFGTVLGLFHGIVFSLLLLSVVKGWHPLKRFRKAGVQVALAHVAGHVGYGLLVGLAIGAFGAHWSM